MTDLCRHERETLRWVLKKSASSWADEYAKLVRLPLSDSTFEPKRNALSAIHDPAKLAEMLAARGRELGWNTYSDDVYDMPVFPCIDFTVDEGVITIDVWRSMHDLESGKNEQRLGMPQARAILLQWLQLPDGAREEAERALRGET